MTIEQALEQYGSNPWIVSSFGKDSVALIDVLAPFGVRNVFWMEDADETVDRQHIAEMQRRYHLNLVPLSRGRVLFTWIKGKPFFLAFPFVSDHHVVVMPTFTPSYEGLGSYVCVDQELTALRGQPPTEIPSILFTGQKASDIGGKGCLELLSILPESFAEARQQEARDAGAFVVVNGLPMHRPLIDWTDADVWAYLEQRSIPVSPLVYNPDHTKKPVHRTWCFQCHDPSQPSIVDCPRINRPILNLSAFHHLDAAAIDQLHALGVLNDAEHEELTRG